MAEKPRRLSTGRFVLGRSAFAKISEVEGIRLSAVQEALFRAFENKGLSAAERLRALKARHVRKG